MIRYLNARMNYLWCFTPAGLAAVNDRLFSIILAEFTPAYLEL